MPPYSAPPSPNGGITATPTPPNEIIAAFWAFLLSAALVVVGGLMVLGQKQAIIDSLRGGLA